MAQILISPWVITTGCLEAAWQSITHIKNRILEHTSVWSQIRLEQFWAGKQNSSLHVSCMDILFPHQFCFCKQCIRQLKHQWNLLWNDWTCSSFPFHAEFQYLSPVNSNNETDILVLATHNNYLQSRERSRKMNTIRFCLIELLLFPHPTPTPWDAFFHGPIAICKIPAPHPALGWKMK